MSLLNTNLWHIYQIWLGILRSNKLLFLFIMMRHTHSSANPYTDDFISRLVTSSQKTQLEKLQSLVIDRPFIDLGAGSADNGYILARLLCASEYVGVERYHFKQLRDSLHNSQLAGFIPSQVVGKDMLDFLQSQDDESASLIYAGAIDTVILGPRDAYVEKIDYEINRILKVGSQYISFRSSLLDLEIQKTETVPRFSIDELYSDTHVLTKIR